MCRHCPFWKLDLREDALRQRVQLLSNYSSGTCHEDASRRTDTEAAEVAEQGNEMTQVHEDQLENSHRERNTLSVCTVTAARPRS